VLMLASQQILSDGPDFDEMKAVAAAPNLTWLAPSPHARQRSTFEGYMLRLADPGVRFDVVWLRCGALPRPRRTPPLARLQRWAQRVRTNERITATTLPQRALARPWQRCSSPRRAALGPPPLLA